MLDDLFTIVIVAIILTVSFIAYNRVYKKQKLQSKKVSKKFQNGKKKRKRTLL